MVLVNGKLPDSALRLTSGGRRLYKTAAASYERVNHAFMQKFGRQLAFNPGWTGYRTLEQQQILFDQLGFPKAAIPGTSNHGYGLAGDFDLGVYGSAAHRWMDTVGRKYGWVPLWESKGLKRNKFEPWHWVYYVGKDQHIPVTAPPVKETDLYTKRDYTGTSKGKTLTDDSWVTIPVEDDGNLSVLLAPGEFDTQVQVSLTGGTAGKALQARFIGIKVVDGKSETTVTYPSVEATVSQGESHLSFNQKGTNRTNERIRFQLHAYETGVKVTSIQVRTDHA